MAETSRTWGETTRVQRGADHVETQVGDQTMMMSISQGRYFAVDDTGQRIWSMLSEPRTIGDIIDALCVEYDVPRDVCMAETLEFLVNLRGHGLVVEAEDDRPAVG